MTEKRIIITGANGNIGAALAEKFASSGNSLLLIFNNSCDRISQIEEKYPKRIFCLQANLTNYKELEKKLNTFNVNNSWLPDSLIHTATLRSIDSKPLIESDYNLWGKIIGENISSTFNILKTCLPFFRKNKSGRIVLFGSNVSRIGLKNGSAYAASKAAIANICRSVSIEEAENKILINTISPGPVKIVDAHFSEEYQEFRQKYYQEQLQQIPMKRLVNFNDIYGVCKFLISEENSYMTGEEIFLTGGKL